MRRGATFAQGVLCTEFTIEFGINVALTEMVWNTTCHGISLLQHWKHTDFLQLDHLCLSLCSLWGFFWEGEQNRECSFLSLNCISCALIFSHKLGAGAEHPLQLIRWASKRGFCEYQLLSFHILMDFHFFPDTQSPAGHSQSYSFFPIGIGLA